MSDIEASGTPKGGDKAGSWNDAAMYNLLLHIVAQLQEGGKSIKWDRIKIPGRTTKSLQNQWTKIRKQLADLDNPANGGGDNPDTPTKTPRKATPRKKAANKAAVLKEEDESSSVKQELSDDELMDGFPDNDSDAEPEPRSKANTQKKRAGAGGAGTGPKGKKPKVEQLDA